MSHRIELADHHPNDGHRHDCPTRPQPHGRGALICGCTLDLYEHAAILEEQVLALLTGDDPHL